ncbi:methyltransferase domain-containing protein [Jimgerdemannia flammicorona]|uniref:Methyltransferase domain-containing protein n=1 Tax=Jimgerdemannia flammicorona TaxID=994334 RepID=A0A433QEZ6_9FUNG|nr:methyltransferase domain-containing protein [Jimgerdemannia flammicorona]
MRVGAPKEARVHFTIIWFLLIFASHRATAPPRAKEKMSSYLPRNALPLPPAFHDSPATDYANALIVFSKKYTWLANIHIVDFFTMAYWHMMDPEWRDALLSDRVGYHELMRLASFSECMEPWPDSIKQFVREAVDLALLRDIPSNYNDGFVSSIDKHIIPGMTEKKLHEVEILSGLIAQVSKETGVSSVIDLGAGQGYLSRALAFQHDLHVLAIDSCSVQTCGAQRYQEMAQKALGKPSQKRKQSSSTARPNEENNISASALTSNVIPSDRLPANASNLHHITQEVTLSSLPTLLADWSTSTFWHQSTATGTASTDARARWLLCGLHACGDLSSHMIRLFLGSDDVRCLVNVGCCYHFLSEGLEDEGATESRFAFPMSRHFQAAQFQMGGTARMLACQAPSRWSERQESTVVSFEHHFFRALLQVGVGRRFPCFSCGQSCFLSRSDMSVTRNVSSPHQYIMVDKGLATATNPPILGRLNKKRDFTSFEVYCHAALRRLKLPLDSITAEEARRYEAEFRLRGGDRQIAIVWTLRVLLAPVLESVVLVDRWCAVREGMQLEDATERLEAGRKGVWMWPLFDRVTSPRNVVIVAVK